MIYINFEMLLNLLFVKGASQNKDFKRVTISEVAEESGVARKILSRVKNNPTYPVSSEHLGKLCEYFFKKFLPLKRPERSEALLMDWVIITLIQVYPDDLKFKVEDALNPSAIEESMGPKQPKVLWDMYAFSKGLPREHFSRGMGDLYRSLFEDEQGPELRKAIEQDPDYQKRKWPRLDKKSKPKKKG